MINFDDSQCSCSVSAPRTNFEFNDATGYQPQRHSLIRFWVFKKLWPFRSKGVSLFFLINLLQNQGKTSANVWAQLSQMALYRNWDRAIVFHYAKFPYENNRENFKIQTFMKKNRKNALCKKQSKYSKNGHGYAKSWPVYPDCLRKEQK